MSIQGEIDENIWSKSIYVRKFPCPPQFTVKNIVAVLDYLPRDGDIVLCSYPKTGTTWMQYIIWQILHKGEDMPSLQDMLSKCIPYVEREGIEATEELSSPRCYKTHFPIHMMKLNKTAKYIYIHRNPLDTLISYFYFAQGIRNGPLELDDFYERFLSGDVPYGDYFDHVLSFEAHKDNSYLQIFSYEDLYKDKKNQVLRLAKFLGDEYHKALVDDAARLQKILDKTSFGHMKKSLKPNIVMKENTNESSISVKEKIGTLSFYHLFRKGIVGEGKYILSPEQVDRLYQKMLIKMKGTNYMQLWA